MNADVVNALQKLVSPIALLVVVLVVWRVRRMSLREDLAVVGPKRSNVRRWFAWLGAWTVWMMVAELVGPELGIEAPDVWVERSVTAVVILFAGMVVLAPIGEELLFRGILYRRLASTALGRMGAVVVVAVLFGVIHVRYGPLLVAFITVDGIWYGLARISTGSVVVPILMHAMGNVYGWYQHLPPELKG